MLLDDNMFLYCGPPVFDAVQLLGKDIWELDELYVKVREDYLSELDPTRRGNMEI
jgi:hypothetical protein